jgi:hypothetical protein
MEICRLSGGLTRPVSKTLDCGTLWAGNYWSFFLRELGATLLKTGDFKTAIVHLEIAAGRLPAFAPAHLSLAEAYEHTGRGEDAKRERSKGK